MNKTNHQELPVRDAEALILRAGSVEATLKAVEESLRNPVARKDCESCGTDYSREKRHSIRHYHDDHDRWRATWDVRGEIAEMLQSEVMKWPSRRMLSTSELHGLATLFHYAGVLFYENQLQVCENKPELYGIYPPYFRLKIRQSQARQRYHETVRDADYPLRHQAMVEKHALAVLKDEERGLAKSVARSMRLIRPHISNVSYEVSGVYKKITGEECPNYKPLVANPPLRFDRPRLSSS